MAKLKVSKVSLIETKVLKKYLEDKCIPLRLAQRYCFEAIIYFKRKRVNIHYLGFLTNNHGIVYKTPWGLTGSQNAGITTITKDGIRFTTPTHEYALVFSGVMDFLSYLVLKNMDEPICDVLILNKGSNVEKGMRFLRQHSIAFCYLSMDERGRKCQKYLEDNLKGCTIVDRSDIYEGEEDLNSLLIKKQTEKAAPAGPRRRKASLKKETL